MAYVITGKCLGERYGACVAVCPAECMHYGDHEGTQMMIINPDTCIDCGACKPECPIDAIVDSEDQSPAWHDFAAKAVDIWPNAHTDEEGWEVRDASEPALNPENA